MAYKIDIQTANGREVLINVPDSGLKGNLDPISGVDVDISTSQSVNQVGESIDSQTVGGVLRTISGECLSTAAAKLLLSALPPLTEGRLILNDLYFAEYVVKKSPYVVRTAGSRNGRTFSLMLYCRKPYWQRLDATQSVLGGFSPAFRFPVNYSTPHRFGVKNASAFVNVRNEGDFPTTFLAEFKAVGGNVENPVLLNVITLKKLRFLTTLEAGQTLRVYHDNDHLAVVRVEHQTETDAFAALDDDSSLFEFAAGDNILRAGADSGEESLQCTVSFNAAYMGVYPDDF